MMRRSYIILLIQAICNLLIAQSTDKNYISNRVMTDENGNNYIENIQYFDGMGTPTELILKNVTPTQKDLVTLQEYDTFDRVVREWLPLPHNGDGGFVDQIGEKIKSYYNDQAPYTENIYESSPFGRLNYTYGVGEEWRNRKKYIKTHYYTNKETTFNCLHYYVSGTNEEPTLSVKPGKYKPNQLYVTRYRDEENNLTYEFKNKLDQIILIRRMNNNQEYNTYYVYDDYGNLTFVLPPLAADVLVNRSNLKETNPVLKKYAYLYRYDHRNRCIAKRIPGCDWTYYIYDKADRLIFTQNGEQRKDNNWVFNIPDVNGRTVLTGIFISDNISYKAYEDKLIYAEYVGEVSNTILGYQLQGFQLNSNYNILSVNYYDNYKFKKLHSFECDSYDSTKEIEFNNRYGDDMYNGNYDETSAKGLLTCTLDKIMNEEGKYLISNYYYNYRGFVIQEQSNNYWDGRESKYYSYNFMGNPNKILHIHKPNIMNASIQTELYKYSYDHTSRLTEIRHQLNNGEDVIVAHNTYDELGRLLKNVINNQPALTLNYEYNIRSWIKKIYGNSFRQYLYYQEKHGSNYPLYNGNITASFTWNNFNGKKIQGYLYKYDNLSRLVQADYGEESLLNINKGRYSSQYSYDKHGNALTIMRNGLIEPGEYGEIDNLTLTYYGNQLKQIEENSSNDPLISTSYDFKDYSGDAENPEYVYNLNGALIKDPYKGADITYNNFLNLPSRVSVRKISGVSDYTYSSTGEKLEVSSQWNSKLSLNPIENTGVSGGYTIRDKKVYIGNKVYINNKLDKIIFEGGYIKNGNYYFYIKDHLGNNALVFDANGNMIQSNIYYPFGMPFAEGVGHEQQPYKYNGKEWETINGLNQYDYHARKYDAVTLNFTSPDPLAEKYYSVSPYVYCANNPILFIDPFGMDIYRYDDKTGEFILYQETDDNFDQVGKFKYDKKTGEYTLQTNKKGEAKTRISHVEKGILSDGINFMENNNIIAVGGEGQATVDGVETFALNLSDMVGKEIGGAYFSKDGTESTTHISIGRYENNRLKEMNGGHGHLSWNRLYPDSKLESSLTGFFHTHPSSGNISVSDRIRPSQQDKNSRDAALKLMPNLQFYILTHPVNYGGKFPYKFPYTTWW